MVEVCIQVGWNIGVQPRKRFKRMMELIRIIAWVSSTFTFPQTDWADQLLHALMHIFFCSLYVFVLDVGIIHLVARHDS